MNIINLTYFILEVFQNLLKWNQSLIYSFHECIQNKNNSGSLYPFYNIDIEIYIHRFVRAQQILFEILNFDNYVHQSAHYCHVWCIILLIWYIPIWYLINNQNHNITPSFCQSIIRCCCLTQIQNKGLICFHFFFAIIT